ncbi:hypothetical protein N7510_001496 [Penicillium lagena]|uniref:uncharacterized protein n=1 Tax=Penicillium lagena TaxID=94218 RepID=UPI0025412F02|nr:uncharacterized protein N7510_001496 [Penicillium lagena]KAJ5625187.1 hypothetical protein N7510_001496 [Penicillium lagena]
MATLAEHPTVVQSSTASPMPTINAGYDQDLDSFINFDQLTYTSSDPSRPKVALASGPSLAGTDFSSDVRSASFASSSQSPIAFQAPSHHYEDHRQQTGLPPGALSMTYNQVSGMRYGNGNQAYPINGEMYGSQMKREEAPFDFNSAAPRNPSEMDIESDGVNSAPYFFQANTANKNQYVDPSALGGQELAQGPSTQVGRMYPGMHQQQAAMAKAQAAQQQQQQFRQPQMQQHRPEEQIPNAIPQNRAIRHPDPVVEERISRLLQQMRQNAMASSEGSPTPSSMLPQMAKTRKDEQDMDEDERLLASEAGKKLTSKERRQLRNKVSARAFRSRRKEYIGQMEGEVAARTNEVHELRLQNRALCEENTRLSELAHMLLASPHFSSFLNDMPDTGVPAQNHPTPQQQSQPQPQQAASQPTMQTSVPKDTNANRNPQEYQMQQNPQVMMVPQQNIDPSAMAMNNGGWNSGIDMNYGNTNVFAVLDIPQGPALDAEVLSGKSSSLAEHSKDERPVIDNPAGDAPTRDIGVANPDVELDESDPAFALFIDSPASVSSEDDSSPFDGVRPEKSSPHFELVVDGSDVTAATKSRFAHLCHSIESAFERVSSVTSHLQ